MLAFAAWAAAASPEQAAPSAPPPAPPTVAHAPAPPQPPDPPSPTDEPEVGGITVTAPKAEPQWSRKLNLDPRGDFAAGAVPYYDRPLVNGCRLALTVRCKKTFW
jgi:hypothetical protein